MSLVVNKPVMIDLFAGLGGWAEGGLAEQYKVVGFDIERHRYQARRMVTGNDDALKLPAGNSTSRLFSERHITRISDIGDKSEVIGGEWVEYPAQLVIQDVLTLHGSQFKDAALIVASPPCQEFSYMAMPWSKAKKIEREYLDGTRDRKKLTALFDACFRIQREAIEAAGHHIPLVVENVRGAQKWVGRARWNFGSFYLWGDVPALMPITSPRQVMKQGITHRPNGETNFHGQKKPGFRFDGSGRSMQSESVDRHIKGIPHRPTGHWTNPAENGTKQGGVGGTSASFGSKSNARKAASAAIARIPLTLARHIARVYYPRETNERA